MHACMYNSITVTCTTYLDVHRVCITTYLGCMCVEHTYKEIYTKDTYLSFYISNVCVILIFLSLSLYASNKVDVMKNVQ